VCVIPARRKNSEQNSFNPKSQRHTAMKIKCAQGYAAQIKCAKWILDMNSASSPNCWQNDSWLKK
jgi:hypothetical protein